MSDSPQSSPSTHIDSPTESPLKSSEQPPPSPIPDSPTLVVEPAPPQPPLPENGNSESPPIVDGIDETAPPSMPSMTASDRSNSEIPVPSDNSSGVIRPGDLAGFSELFARFHSRIEKVSAGRKYRPLRDAWDSAADEIGRTKDRVNLVAVTDYVMTALRLGCESGKILIVDACLDCIHRLFEYGHAGSGTETTGITLDVREAALDELVAIVCACLEVKDEDVYLRMVQTLLTSASRTRAGLHQSTLLAAVRTIYNIFLNARMPGTRTTARVSLTQILNLVFTRMETENTGVLSNVPEFSVPVAPEGSPPEDGHNSSGGTQAVDVPNPTPPAEDGDDVTSEFTSVLQRDAYLLFRALCKLSAKEFVDTTSPDAVGLRSKLLSLELVRNLISNSGPAFRSGDRFIYALRQYLARSLLINCMWNSFEVMDVSFDIFEMILRKDTLRPLLKTEISALFDTVVFRFLESPTAGHLRKRRALTLLNRLSTDRQTMADLFLNYDCDMESPKIFERIVHVVSAAAQDKSPPVAVASQSSTTPATVQIEVRIVALTSVVQVVRSLREWSKPIEESKEQSRSYEISPRQNENPPSQASYTGDEEAPEDSGTLTEGKGLCPAGESKISEQTPSHGRPLGASGSAYGLVSEGNDRDTTRFEVALKAKRDTAEGVKLFNSKPKRGIEYLIAHDRLHEDASEIARFLHKAEDLDAAMVGEYLGDAGTLNINVMHSYTDIYDFTNMKFDSALRLHLSGFRLPGEAQKIDRIMEKFASRFCECNPGIFANADAAYILSYSAIMLHTDAHNETIKNKMSKEEFVKNNRGINDGGDLDPVFLGNLYDRITKMEIRLSSSKRDSATGADKVLNAAAATVAAMDPVQRARQFEQESERLMAQTKVLFTKKGRPTHDYTYYSATNVHHARLMFDTAWYPILAAVSLNLEEATPSDTNIVSLCLDGFRHGIAISSTFGMPTAKDAFVSSLAKFTHLNNISEMRTKNVECVRMILAIAAMEGNNLGEQWVLIVRAISVLEQIRAVAGGSSDKYLLQKAPLIGIGAGMRTTIEAGSGKASAMVSSSPLSPDKGTSGNAGVPAVSSDTFRRLSSGKTNMSSTSGGVKSEGGHRIDSKAASLASTVPEAEIERIFMNSSKLSANGVADFCGALCTVALEELSESPVPRLFCIQKIVEMAYYNMDSRTRIQWGKIWDQMGPFFVSAMCHSNREVAMYAIDALRQLASKFLEKDELSNFSFQKAFLKPFEMCYSRSKSAGIRELVLSCISQIVLARAANIKSGWKSVFAVLGMAADDKMETIMNFGWQIVDSITRKYVGVLDDVYIDAVMGIAMYAKSTLSTPISLAAIDLLSGRCASLLCSGAGNADEGLFSGDNDGHIGWWFPILTGLAASMQDERSAVRLAANNGLYKVLNEYGGRFAPSMWTLVFRGVLSPIFDDVRHLSSSHDRNETVAVGEWATTTGATALRSVVDVFVMHLEVSKVVLDELLGLIRSWILQENESVAREGMNILAKLIMSAGDKLDEEDWKRMVTALNETFVDSMPHEILGTSWAGRKDGKVIGNAEAIDNEGGVGNEEIKVKTERNNEKPESGNTREEAKAGMGNGFREMVKAGSEESSGSGANSRETAEAKIDFRVVRAKCVVQLLLIEVAQEVVVSFYGVLGTSDIMSLSQSLEKSYKFAHEFNADIELRYSLWRTGFMNQVPNLLKQETNGLMALLRIMFWLYLDQDRCEADGWGEDAVIGLCESVIRRYIGSCEEGRVKADERREVAALSPVVSFIVQSVRQMSEQQFERHMQALYNLVLDLLDSADDTDVRRSATQLLRVRVAPGVSVGGGGAGRMQLPGEERTKLMRVKMVADAHVRTVEEICGTVTRVGGVRSVKVCDGQDELFRVVTCAPDEMVVAGAMGLAFVKAAFIERDVNMDLD